MQKMEAPPSPAASPLVKIINSDDEDTQKQPVSARKRQKKNPTNSSVPNSPSSSFVLPDGWTVEEKRRDSIKGGRNDKFYFEPGTRKKFRSLKSVQKYLTETSGNMSNESENHVEDTSKSINKQENTSSEKLDTPTVEPASSQASSGIMNESENHFQNGNKPCFQEETMSSADLKNTNFDFSTPPEKVTWVHGSRADSWTPFIGGSVVEEAEKKLWAEKFTLSQKATEGTSKVG